MTLLVTSIAATDISTIREKAERAWSAGSDAAELRIDSFSGDEAELTAYLSSDPKRTWIITCRSAAEGGSSSIGAGERAALLARIASATDVYVDYELADWSAAEDHRQRVREASARPVEPGHRLILSAHDCGGVMPNATGVAKHAAAVAEAHVAKIAFAGGDVCANFVALDLLHDATTPTIAMCMGEVGILSRVLAKKLGAFATYAALEAGGQTAPGQVSIRDMKVLYRWDAIDEATKVFGVVGDPVAHSLSPFLFNQWFDEAGINAVYLPLRVNRDGDCFERFITGCLDRPWLNVGGVSVTIPHKQAALRVVGDAAGRTAAAVHAVNTLVFGQNEVVGNNTDCHASVGSMADALELALPDLKGIRVDVLGAGGAARAVVTGLWAMGCRVTLYGRSPDTTETLAKECHAAARPWDERLSRNGDVLINCTSVGMWPEVDASPMPPDALNGCRLVFDMIYNPLQTKLLAGAEQAGIPTLNGLDMFIRQASMQFELWTDQPPPSDGVREKLEAEIHRRHADAP